MKYNALLLEAAGRHVGLSEWPGTKHNPEVIAFFEASGHGNVRDDETPWCAAFVGAVLAEIGLTGTGKLNARSYLDWGEKVEFSAARPGDVVVLWRGSPDGWQGHVAFLVGFNGDKVILRGGNQGNKVSDQRYPVSRILGIRRADAAQAEMGRPTLREGARGAFVLDLQDQLRSLRYFAGQRDGVFGPRTGAAVRDFQNEAGLSVDGIVGQRTWAALEKAPQRPERQLTASELRTRGSSTIKAADTGKVVVAAGAAIPVIDAATEAADKAQGLLPTLTAMVTDHWPALLVLGLGVVGYVLWRQVTAARVEDARSGAHLGR
ncbi:TIGR02594 family protein [Oceanicola sp. D3]|uniref:C40 family peptidase n=1 Tax=Oceanicola sp. D3 TaxID=2587163 RepID=UPI0011217267|nr:TIGR02594 family protein [Oceanicola sp. D3]QDC11288.1 TIGR02594 family protein [Oceanicola sp. D3]